MSSNPKIPKDMLLRYGQEFVPLTSKLNFEQRILEGNAAPSLQGTDGSRATHRMAYAESGGRHVAYPTIVESLKGRLNQLGDDEAFYNAMRTGEFREFGNEKEAADYARGGYKMQWGAKNKKQQNSLMDMIKEIQSNPKYLMER